MRRRQRLDPKRRDTLALSRVKRPRPPAEDKPPLTSDVPDTHAAREEPMLLFAAGLLLLLVCYFAVTLTSLHDSLPAQLRIAVVVLTASLVPGAAVLTLVRAAVPATVVALSIALSFAIDSVASVVLVWSGWWHADALVALGAGASAGLLVIDATERWRRRQRAGTPADGREPPGWRNPAWARIDRGSLPTLVPILSIAVALALWVIALRQVGDPHLGQYGLLPGLPAIWYVALALAVLGTTASLLTPAPHAVAIVAGIGAITLILFGTIPALYEFPQYSWTYKHLGVVRLIETRGQVDPNLDIYNRWPGFFAPAAVLTSIAGVANPVTYAAWAEVFFSWIDALMIAAVVWSVTRSKRIAGGAAMLFIIGNWVGQNYYSPQAFSFVLALACILPLMSALATQGADVARRTLGTVGRVTRSSRQALASPPTFASPQSAVILIVVVYAAIVASHQLSPYVVIAQVGLLGALSLIRPRWLVAVLALMAFSYLFANYAYLREHFGILSSLDPFNNASASSRPAGHPSAGKDLATRASILLTGGVWLGALVSYARLSRQGLSRQALPLLVLAFAPAAILLAQSYGGEATLRVILFSFPWCVALIAWALFTIRGQIGRSLALVTVAATMTVLLVIAFFGQAGLTVMRPGDVRASDYLYTHAAAGSAVVLASDNFPASYGARYSLLSKNAGGSPPVLLTRPEFSGRIPTARDLPAIESKIRDYGRHGYLVFSSTEQTFIEIMGTSPRTTLPRLETLIAHSSRFRRWYSKDGVRIYEYGFAGS